MVVCGDNYGQQQTVVSQDVVRGLGITERTAVLAAAVSIDFD